MKMNRRNALLGLGAIATGGGALFGSGAFSQVTAERAVTLSISNDRNANLGLAANNTSGNIANNSAGGGTELGIDGDSLNPDATTTFHTAFDITNNSNNQLYISHTGISGGSSINSIDLYLAGDVGNDIGSATWGTSDYVIIDTSATLVTGLQIDTQEVSSATTDNLTLTLEAAAERTDLTGPPSNSLGTETS